MSSDMEQKAQDQLEGSIIADAEADAKQIINFNPEVTPEALALIQKQAAELPEVITSEKEFKEVYTAYQEIRRLRIAVDKKKDELQKIEKVKFENKKIEIANEAKNIYCVLTPLEHQLSERRQDWETKKQKLKEEAAAVEAARQKAEFDRRQKIIRDRDHIEGLEINTKFDADKNRDEERKAEEEKLAAERLELAREKEQFEIEKNRLSFDDAWDDAYPTATEELENFPKKQDEIEAYEAEEKREAFKKMNHNDQMDTLCEMVDKVLPSPMEEENDNEKLEEILDLSKNFRDFLNAKLNEDFVNNYPRDMTRNLKNQVLNGIANMQSYLDGVT